MDYKKPLFRNVWLYRFLDFLIPVISLSIIIHKLTDMQISLGVISGLLFVLFAQYQGIYRSDTKEILNKGLTTLKIWSFLSISILIIDRAITNFQISNIDIFLWFLLTPIFFYIYRSIFKKFLLNQDLLYRNIAIIGAGDLGVSIAKSIQNSKFYSKALINFFDDNEELKGLHMSDIPVIDKASEFKKYVNNYNLVYICLPLACKKEINEIIELSSEHSVILKFVPDIPTFDFLSSNVEDFYGHPIIGITNTPSMNLTLRVVKRIEDLILSIIIISLISPLMFFISVVIKISSRGSVLFKQKRYGLDGNEFVMYKFRTMTTSDNGRIIKQAKKNDKRVTKVGLLLRKTSLDELPQFFNVIKGEMSIVGPRPHAVAHNKEYKKLISKYMQRHLMKPGITGWAQINGYRGEIRTLQEMQTRVDFDLHYINTWSLWLDIKIILISIYKGFISKKAY